MYPRFSSFFVSRVFVFLSTVFVFFCLSKLIISYPRCSFVVLGVRFLSQVNVCYPRCSCFPGFRFLSKVIVFIKGVR